MASFLGHEEKLILGEDKKEKVNLNKAIEVIEKEREKLELQNDINPDEDVIFVKDIEKDDTTFSNRFDKLLEERETGVQITKPNSIPRFSKGGCAWGAHKNDLTLFKVMADSRRYEQNREIHKEFEKRKTGADHFTQLYHLVKDRCQELDCWGSIDQEFNKCRLELMRAMDTSIKFE